MMRLAGCAVFDDVGRVLLVHRVTPDLTQWELPGGKVEAGEQPQAAAVREIKEELGVEVEVIRPLGTANFDFRGTPCEYHCFEARIASGEPKPQEAMHTECAYVALDDETKVLSHGAFGLREVLGG